MDKVKVLLLSLAKASTDGDKLNEEVIKAYMQTIRNYPPELVLSVLSKYSYLPPVEELSKKLEEKKTLLAFEMLQRAIEKAGKYGAVVFEDKKLQAFVRLMGGWLEVCDMPERELRHWFFKLYPSIEEDRHEEVFTTEFTFDDAKVLRVKALGGDKPKALGAGNVVEERNLKGTQRNNA